MTFRKRYIPHACTKTSNAFSKLRLRWHMSIGKTHDVVFPKVSI